MAMSVPLTRSLAFTTIALLHVVGFATIGVGAVQSTPTAAMTILVRNVAAPPVADITVVPKLSLTSVPMQIDAPTIETENADTIATGDCSVIEALQTALASDQAVVKSLAALPASLRSTTNAVTVWNDRWTARDDDVVRAAVTAGLKAMPAPCRAAVVTGPRLLIVAAGARPVVLAFGSGNWRWGDLLADTRPTGAT